MPTLALIDGNSIAYRAFYALPDDLATRSGQITNAVFGFTRMLVRLLKDHHPDAMAVAWDVSRKTFRTDSYPEYKAQREKAPDHRVESSVSDAAQQLSAWTTLREPALRSLDPCTDRRHRPSNRPCARVPLYSHEPASTYLADPCVEDARDRSADVARERTTGRRPSIEALPGADRAARNHPVSRGRLQRAPTKPVELLTSCVVTGRSRSRPSWRSA